MNRSEMLEKMHMAVGVSNVQAARKIALEYAQTEVEGFANDLRDYITQGEGFDTLPVILERIDQLLKKE